ncbi:MAG: epoxyqueuosine reductase QueH [Erysipelotrichaceae bacterium]
MNKSKHFYFNLMSETLAQQDKKNKKSLLLHSCCAPCNGWVVMMLSEYFDLTLYFNNSNIYPFQEYNRRLAELKKFVAEFNPNIKIVHTEYNQEYQHDFFALKDIKEGGERCLICYQKRMEEAWSYADKHNFDYFTTVMSISRQKDSLALNKIGEKLENKYRTPYFFSDFKKGGGMEKALAISKQFAMYRQDYCGCIYSIKKPSAATLDYLANTNIFLFQNQNMFRINTDTSLLGNYLPALNGKSVLDVGCNNGALILYAYYKSATVVAGIDINQKAIEMAKFNVDMHMFDSSNIQCVNVKDYDEKTFDVVVCNPPYFENSTKNANLHITKARHLDSLSLTALIKHLARLIKNDGKIYLVYRYDLQDNLMAAIEVANLFIVGKQLAYDNRVNKYKSILLTLSKKKLKCLLSDDVLIG